MQVWQKALADDFPNIVIADMPAKHRSFECCLDKLVKTVDAAGPEHYQQLYLAGHSMGGLLLREYLALRRPQNARKLICVGTPHYGSKLSDIALLMPGAGWVWPPLLALRRSARKQITVPDISGLKVAVIVGRNNAHWPGKYFLPEPADGLVEAYSALAPDADSVAYTDVPHDYMQYDSRITDLIKEFFLNGTFNS